MTAIRVIMPQLFCVALGLIGVSMLLFPAAYKRRAESGPRVRPFKSLGAYRLLGLGCIAVAGYIAYHVFNL